MGATNIVAIGGLLLQWVPSMRLLARAHAATLGPFAQSTSKHPCCWAWALCRKLGATHRASHQGVAVVGQARSDSSCKPPRSGGGGSSSERLIVQATKEWRWWVP